MPAPGGPKAVYRLDLGSEPIVALAAAGRAPVLAVVRENDVLLLDTSSPLRPARSAPRALPPEIRRAHVVAADSSPDGKLLAVATAEGNRVALLDLVPRGSAALAGGLVVVPEVRESVLVDVAFSPAGDTLWVLSGDTARSRASGPQPTELRALRLGTSPESLSNLEVARVVAIGAARAPARMPSATRRRWSAAPPSACRPNARRCSFPRRADARGSSRLAAGSPAATTPNEAAVFRVGVEDAATVAIAALGGLGMPDLSFDGRWLLAPLAAGDGSVRVPVEYRSRGHPVRCRSSRHRVRLRRGAPLIVRQDPDIIMVGEIRDYETAEIAVRAALTGHLVFSTLHTNDAAGAITRLIKWASSHPGQPRLSSAWWPSGWFEGLREVRKEAYRPSAEEAALFGHEPVPEVLYRGRGCKVCRTWATRGAWRSTKCSGSMPPSGAWCSTAPTAIPCAAMRWRAGW